MAMRGRGGRGDASRPLRLNVGRVYEQFKPMSEWRQEENYDTLLLYLPGFQKEYIKVTTEETNIVRVHGERLVAENKWSRFQEDYRVPENCETRGIRARFDGGILTITMPRKIITTPETAITTTTTRPTSEPEEQPMRRTKQEEEALPKRKQDSKEQLTSSNAALEPEKKPDKPKSTRLEPTPTSSSRPIKQEPIKTVREPTKTDDKFTLPTTIPKKDKHDAVEKPTVAGKKDFDDGKGKGKEAILEEEMKRDSEDRKGQSNDPGVVTGVGYRMEENTKVAMRRMNLNEDRKLLMNVGVGVLVIVALGVHVSYTLGLIGKGK